MLPSNGVVAVGANQQKPNPLAAGIASGLSQSARGLAAWPNQREAGGFVPRLRERWSFTRVVSVSVSASFSVSVSLCLCFCLSQSPPLFFCLHLSINEELCGHRRYWKPSGNHEIWKETEPDGVGRKSMLNRATA